MTQHPQQDCQELITQGLTGFLSADGGEPWAGTRCDHKLGVGGEMQSACWEIRPQLPGIQDQNCLSRPCRVVWGGFALGGGWGRIGSKLDPPSPGKECGTVEAWGSAKLLLWS